LEIRYWIPNINILEMDFFLFVQRKNFHQHSISLNFDTEEKSFCADLDNQSTPE